MSSSPRMTVVPSSHRHPVALGRACLVLGLLAAGACHRRGQPAAEPAAAGGEVEDLTIVVEADKSRILQEESVLAAKRAAFEEEQRKVAQQRSEITGQLATLSKKDRTQRDKLEAAERQLAAEQQAMRARAASFEAERSKLDAEKGRLLARLDTPGAPPAARAAALPQREEAVARRERDVAARERDVARREAEAARGLGDIGKKLAELRAAPAAAPPPAPAAPALGRRELARLQRSIHARMAARGILDEDLPPTARALDETGGDMRDLAAAQAALGQLAQAVDAVQVNHSFVQAKMARINGQFEAAKRDHPLDEARQKAIEALLGDAGDSFGEGRYDRANKKINQINQILQRP